MAGLSSFKEYIQVQAQSSKQVKYTDVWNKVKDNKAHEKDKTNTIWYTQITNPVICDNADPPKPVCLRCCNQPHQGTCKEPS